MQLPTVTSEEAQAKLPELIDHLSAGEELVITRKQQPIARSLPKEPLKRQARKPGSDKVLLTILVEDDEHLVSSQ